MEVKLALPYYIILPTRYRWIRGLNLKKIYFMILCPYFGTTPSLFRIKHVGCVIFSESLDLPYREEAINTKAILGSHVVPRLK